MRTIRSTVLRTSSSNQVLRLTQRCSVHPCVVLNRRVQTTNFLCTICRLLTNLVCKSRLCLTNRFMWARHKISDLSSGCRSQALLQKVWSSIGSQICWHRTCGAALWVSGHIWIGSSTDRCCFLKCISSVSSSLIWHSCRFVTFKDASSVQLARQDREHHLPSSDIICGEAKPHYRQSGYRRAHGIPSTLPRRTRK